MIGLNGYSDLISFGGRTARDLWASGLFDSFLSARHDVYGVGLQADERNGVFSMGSCHAASKRFLTYMAGGVVVGVFGCWPRQLFYFAAHEYGVRTAVLASEHPTEAEARSYAYRYARLIICPNELRMGQIISLFPATPAVVVGPGDGYAARLRAAVLAQFPGN